VPKERLSLEKCLNCSYDFTAGKMEKFCPECGQENTDKRIGVSTLILDFLGDYFTFDSKLFRSLRHLVLSPGYLTSSFNGGKRIRYIPPLRMYIFISFLFFLGLRFTIAQYDVNTSLMEVKDEAFRNDTTSVNTGEFGAIYISDEELKIYYELDSTEIVTADHKRDFLENYDPERMTRIMKPENFIQKLVVRELDGVLKSSRGKLINIAISNTSIALFIAMPLFALLLFVFFRRRTKFYIEHLIHSIHLHTWVFIMMVLLLLLHSQLSMIILLCFVLAYVFQSTRFVYEESVLRTSLKLFAINLIYLIFLIIVFSLLAVISLIQL